MDGQCEHNGQLNGHVGVGTEIPDFEGSEASQTRPIFPSTRLVVSLVSVLGCLCNQGSQAVVAATIIAMIRRDNGTSPGDPAFLWNDEFDNNTDRVNETISTSTDTDSRWRYDWTKSTHAWLVSSFFIAFTFAQLPVGWLTSRYSNKRLVVGSCVLVIVGQLASIWTPSLGPTAFGLTLVLWALPAACFLPAVAGVMAKWCPPQESTTLMALAYAGSPVGIGYMYFVSALTTTIPLFGGWPFNFVIMAVTVAIFAALWTLLVTDTPEQNRFAKAGEVTYINQSLSVHGKRSVADKVPWCRILTSRPVYGITAAQFGSDWLMYSFINIYPAYMITVRRMDVTTVSVLFSVPWLFCPPAIHVVSTTVDTLRRRNVLSTTALRKLADVIGKTTAAGAVLAASFLPDNYVNTSAAIFAVAIFVFMSFANCSWVPNVAELSPDYAGLVFSISQIFGMTSSYIAPVLFAHMTPNDTAGEWQSCFGVTLAICVSSSIVYVILGSSEPQQWTQDENRYLLMRGSASPRVSKKDKASEVGNGFAE